jgi:CDP-paratose 2-epimerase
MGDHKWWITDTRKFQSAYPGWKQEYSLEQTVAEIVAAQQQREAA